MSLDNTNKLSNKDKRKIRYNVINLLYDYQIGNLNIEEIFEKFWEGKEESSIIKEYTKKLYKNVLENLEEIDMIISKYLKKGWTLERLYDIDKAILRVATYEILKGNLSPAEAVINDAINFAKKYSNDKSPKFINAILDTILKKEKALKKEGGNNERDFK